MADRFRICIIDIGSRDYGINIVILNDNIMKMKRTFITAFFAMLLVVFSVSCSSEEKEFDYAALPMSAQLFVKWSLMRRESGRVLSANTLCCL